MADEKHGRTLFVRNVPYSSTNDTLEKVFSDVGPIKSCFVVKDKESGKCRGFGYVKFTLFEDAEKALKTVKKIDGRNVHIVYANKKEKIKKKFGQPQKVEQEENASTNVQENALTNVQETKHETSKKNKQQKKAFVPIKGQKQDPNPLNEGKRARLIIRNLSFKCTKEELETTFGKYGDVVDVHIPMKGSGTRLGFGFVQFKNRAQAGMAVKEINGKNISGRAVAVDWALPKDKFESKLVAKDVKLETENDESMEVGDDDQDEESEEEIINNDSVKKKRLEESSSSEEEESSEEEPEEDESSREEDEDEDESAFSEEDDSDADNEASKTHHLPPPERESDVKEGRTVFVRNLPYSIENEELEDFFSQFGDVKYARVVVDRTSGMPKGSAFVQFQSKHATDSCMESAAKGEESGMSLGGRNLIVSLAVNKQEAGEFSQKDKKKEQKDTRNLYLAREGMIRPGTDAAKDVPPADLAKRLKIDAAKRMKLKDQNIFVSSTRICVHNIPTIETDQSLRAVVAKAAGVKEKQVLECRIMRDLDRLNTQGIGKSRGYAFCAFAKHEQALAALRNLNNNPDIFGNNKRLIVEFSLENRKALEAKQKRLEKSRAKLKQKGSQISNSSANNTVNPRKRKFNSKAGQKPLESKKEQDKVARSLHKGPLGLPSHSGPKQRHKARPSQQGMDKNKGKNLNLRNNSTSGKWQQQLQQKSQKEKPIKLKSLNKKRNDTDSFDKLVAAYKQKILSSASF